MNFFSELLLIESEISSQKEINHCIAMVNSVYSEWKKTGRRKNAIDLIAMTVNKLSLIDPAIVYKLHDATKIKLAALLLRCFDIPYWKNPAQKEKIYTRLYDLINTLRNQNPGTDSGGTLKEVICTRLSSAICYNSDNKNIFVAYEPSISNEYLRYLFGKEQPTKTYKMQLLAMPPDFSVLLSILRADHKKAVAHFTEKNLSG